MRQCKAIGCSSPLPQQDVADFCPDCLPKLLPAAAQQRLSQLYPRYYKDVSHLDEIDVYAVHQAFAIDDPSGAIQHASKKLLLSGVRTGNKSKYEDVREARDTLTRWLQLHPHLEPVTDR